ncbi:hypothetical protein AAVH_04762 [Aphelenchoides avenae]|nr:hypothetical protein AAVH_04762 [Aphelenchus avenae]
MEPLPQERLLVEDKTIVAVKSCTPRTVAFILYLIRRHAPFLPIPLGVSWTCRPTDEQAPSAAAYYFEIDVYYAHDDDDYSRSHNDNASDNYDDESDNYVNYYCSTAYYPNDFNRSDDDGHSCGTQFNRIEHLTSKYTAAHHRQHKAKAVFYTCLGICVLGAAVSVVFLILAFMHKICNPSSGKPSGELDKHLL